MEKSQAEVPWSMGMASIVIMLIMPQKLLHTFFSLIKTPKPHSRCPFQKNL